MTSSASPVGVRRTVIALRVRELRIEKDLTRSALARRARISLRTLAYIESGHITEPRPLTVQRLAIALCVTADDICTPETVTA